MNIKLLIMIFFTCNGSPVIDVTDGPPPPGSVLINDEDQISNLNVATIDVPLLSF